MRKLLLTLSITSLVACSAPIQQNYNFPEWKPFGYKGLKDKVDRLAGPDAINCGFVDRLSNEKSKIKIADNQLTLSQACIDQAIKNKRSFKYGSVRVASTSYLWEIVLLTPEQEFWKIIYDYSMDESGTLHFVKRCKSLAIDVSHARFDSKVCTEIPTKEWLDFQ